ncbi:MAG TPA: hypothetical protein VLK53_10945 [Gaiellaceae bacterium]|nr:hypothetical protein [Gaiellaceae bacterium]
MQVQELATGLWYWTGRHPGWTPADGGPDGWDQEVGCYFYDGPDAICLFDPLIPMEDRDRFFEALDRDVEQVQKRVRILLTVDAHRRSAVDLAERHDIDPPPLPPERPRLPAGVEIVAEAAGEFVFWLPEHRALIAGDLIIGRAHGLEVPRAWLEDRYEEMVERLRPLLDLPVDRVLVTHGEPVLEDGLEALERALA